MSISKVTKTVPGLVTLIITYCEQNIMMLFSGLTILDNTNVTIVFAESYIIVMWDVGLALASTVGPMIVDVIPAVVVIIIWR